MMFGELSGEFSAEYRARHEERGRQRMVESRRLGLTDRSYAGDPDGKHDMQSWLSEQIVADVFGLPEPRSGTYKNERDVGPFEVREVTRDNGDTRGTSLIIRPKDLEKPEISNAPFLLVVLRDNSYRIPGWAFGFDGPTLGSNYARNGDPCWFVPISALYKIDADLWEDLETWKQENLDIAA